MTKIQPDAHTNYLRVVLEEMANTSQKILSAGIDGDDKTVRIGVDRLRQLRSDMSAVDPKYHDYFDTAVDAEKTSVKEHLFQYRKAKGFCAAWTQRYKAIGDYQKLLSIEGGIDGIIDMHLPEAWDWEKDVIAFSVYSNSKIIEAILERGQKRVLIFGSKSDDKTQDIPGVTYLTADTELLRYFQDMLLKFPKQIIFFDKLIGLTETLDEKQLKVYEESIEKIEKRFSMYIANENTIRMLGKKWTTQGIENLPLIANHPSYKHLSAHIAGRPLVIASPGPSLDKNIDKLKQLENRAILVAPAQSITALHRNNIQPDVVMVADPSDLLYLFEGVDISRVRALLIGVSCHPALFEKFNKKVISLNVNTEADRWISKIFGDEYGMGSSGSVSSMAFVLAGAMRSDPIILVGQDLSFTGNKQYSKDSANGQVEVKFNEHTGTHAYEFMPDALDKLMKEDLGDSYQGYQRMATKTLTLPGYYGGTVFTKPDYLTFHLDFETRATEYLKRTLPPRLLNCTEGGAYINGFQHIPLQEAVTILKADEFTDLNKDEIFSRIFNDIDYTQRNNNLKKALKDIIDSLRSGVLLAEKCRSAASLIIKGRSSLDELYKNERRLIATIKDSDFINTAIQDEVKLAIQIGESATNLRENLEAKIILYNLVIRECKKFLPLIRNVIPTPH